MKKYFLVVVLLTAVIITAATLKKSSDKEKGSHKIDPQVSTEINRVLDEYINTFSKKDLKGWESTYHFPHYRLASGKMSVLEKAGLRDSAQVFTGLVNEGWDYSKWDHRNIVQASADKVHVDTRFSRYRKDGSLIGNYESLYILTKENNKWGVKMRSSYAE